MAEKKNARNFLNDLKSMIPKDRIKKYEGYFAPDFDEIDEDVSVGVDLGQVISLSEEYAGMPLEDIEKLLDSPVHEARMGAVSIMDWEARNPNLPHIRRKALFELYLRRHDRINSVDLVDRAAPNVVGGYLYNNQREILYELAQSADPWLQRTAIVSTYYFIRHDELDDTFNLAEILIHDDNEMVQNVVGGYLREAGRENTMRLLDFLNRHAASIPKNVLYIAIDELSDELRKKYLDENKDHKGK